MAGVIWGPVPQSALRVTPLGRCFSGGRAMAEAGTAAPAAAAAGSPATSEPVGRQSDAAMDRQPSLQELQDMIARQQSEIKSLREAAGQAATLADTHEDKAAPAPTLESAAVPIAPDGAGGDTVAEENSDKAPETVAARDDEVDAALCSPVLERKSPEVIEVVDSDQSGAVHGLSLIHISEPTRPEPI
eukprot:2005222-Pyramimonas_sp.AAC.1